MRVNTRHWRWLALACWSGLLLLNLAWEIWLAPTGKGVALLKTLPLTLALPGLLSGRCYTYQLWSMLILAWFVEGVMRAWGAGPPIFWLAWGEIIFSLGFFAAALGYARSSGRQASAV